MDYCSSCRRHLNGALVCPGCGAYAPDIAPAVAHGHAVPAPVVSATTGAAAAAAAWDAMASDTWHDSRPRTAGDEAASTADLRESPQADSPDVLPVTPSAPQGRAARRRQRARWKKNQRRAVVATAVALVGGGLTVSMMDRQSGDRAQAATAPESAGTDTRTGPNTSTGTGTAEEPSAPYTRPSATRPDSGRSSPISPETDRQRRQNVPAPTSTTPKPNTQPDAVAPPRTSSRSNPRSQSASPTAEGTPPDRSAVAPTPTPTPSATDGSGSGTPETSPAPAATSPSQICLLVICLG